MGVERSSDMPNACPHTPPCPHTRCARTYPASCQPVPPFHLPRAHPSAFPHAHRMHTLHARPSLHPTPRPPHHAPTPPTEGCACSAGADTTRLAGIPGHGARGLSAAWRFLDTTPLKGYAPPSRRVTGLRRHNSRAFSGAGTTAAPTAHASAHYLTGEQRVTCRAANEHAAAHAASVFVLAVADGKNVKTPLTFDIGGVK